MTIDEKLDIIKDKINDVKISVTGIKGDIRVIKEQMAHKADKYDANSLLSPRLRQTLIYSAVVLGGALAGLIARYGG